MVNFPGQKLKLRNSRLFGAFLFAALLLAGIVNATHAATTPTLKKVFVYGGESQVRLVVLFDGPLSATKPTPRIKNGGLSLFIGGAKGGKVLRKFTLDKGGYERLEARERGDGLFLSILKKDSASNLKSQPMISFGKSSLTLTLPSLKGGVSAGVVGPQVSKSIPATLISRRPLNSPKARPGYKKSVSKSSPLGGTTADAMLSQALASSKFRRVSTSTSSKTERVSRKSPDTSGFQKGAGDYGRNGAAVSSAAASKGKGIGDFRAMLRSSKKSGKFLASLNSSETQKISKTRKKIDFSSKDLGVGSAAPDASSVAFKFAGALGVILSLILGALVFFKKVAPSAVSRFGGNGSIVRTLHKTTLAPKKSLAVVEVAGEVLVLGISGQNIAMLTKIENADALERVRASSASSESSFVEQLSKMMGNAGGDSGAKGKEVVNGAAIEKAEEVLKPAAGGAKEKSLAALIAYSKQVADAKAIDERALASERRTATAERSAARLRSRLDRLTPPLEHGVAVL